MKILNIVGARPNFMKMAPIVAALNAHQDAFEHLLVHTGQHYDEKMSKTFFEALDLPPPDVDLGVGSGSHAVQTAKIMMAFEDVCLRENPDLVIVVGDVNSTLACTITAKKLGIAVAHVEAGLRSNDMAMPEEINRLCTDVLCDLLFTTDRMADANLLREGVAPGKIHFVGNVMIDTLMKHRAAAAGLSLSTELGLTKGGYGVLTLHRPSNVDDPEVLAGVIGAIRDLSNELPIIFPAHPRTLARIRDAGLEELIGTGNIRVTDPLGYLEFLHLNMNARMVLTDSGGLQEETTVLGVPCITLRHNTERPITVSQGTNHLIGNDPGMIRETARAVMSGTGAAAACPEKWDGEAATRIVEVLRNWQPKM